MFDIAPEVIRWHAGGQEAVLARVVSVTGLSSTWRGQAVALSSGNELAGAVLASVAVPQLLPVLTRALNALGSAPPPAAAEHAAQNPRALLAARSGVVIDVLVSDEEAKGAGLECGKTARILVQDTADLVGPAWQFLADREPICLVSDLEGPYVGRTTWFTLTSGQDDPVGAGSTRHGSDVFELFGRGPQLGRSRPCPTEPRPWWTRCGRLFTWSWSATG